MSSRRTLILVLAIGIGLVAGWALLSYVQGIEDEKYNDARPVDVLVATSEIPAGTPIDQAAQSFETKQVPLEIKPTTAVAPGDVQSLAQLVSQGTIVQNQIILSDMFVDPQQVQTSFQDAIHSGNVAVSLQVSEVNAVGGYVQPGDRVNILVNHEDRVCNASSEDSENGDDNPSPTPIPSGPIEGSSVIYCSYTEPARYLYQQVEVLAVGSQQQTLGATQGDGETGGIVPIGGIITVMVPPEAAQIIKSVGDDNIVLTLLPTDYSAEPLPAFSEAVIFGPTPAELVGCLTPYGADGFVEGDAALVAEGQEGDPAQGAAFYSCREMWGE